MTSSKHPTGHATPTVIHLPGLTFETLLGIDLASAQRAGRVLATCGKIFQTSAMPPGVASHRRRSVAELGFQYPVDAIWSVSARTCAVPFTLVNRSCRLSHLELGLRRYAKTSVLHAVTIDDRSIRQPSPACGVARFGLNRWRPVPPAADADWHGADRSCNRHDTGPTDPVSPLRPCRS